MFRLVIDTNILIAAFLTPKGLANKSCDRCLSNTVSTCGHFPESYKTVKIVTPEQAIELL